MASYSRRLFIANNGFDIRGLKCVWYFHLYQVLLTAIELNMSIFVCMHEKAYKTLGTVGRDHLLVNQESNGKQAKYFFWVLIVVAAPVFLTYLYLV